MEWPRPVCEMTGMCHGTGLHSKYIDTSPQPVSTSLWRIIMQIPHMFPTLVLAHTNGDILACTHSHNHGIDTTPWRNEISIKKRRLENIYYRSMSSIPSGRDGGELGGVGSLGSRIRSISNSIKYAICQRIQSFRCNAIFRSSSHLAVPPSHCTIPHTKSLPCNPGFISHTNMDTYIHTGITYIDSYVHTSWHRHMKSQR